MKRAVSLILALVLCFGLCACGSSTGTTESLSSRAADEVKSRISFYVSWNYDIVGVPNITTYTKEIGNNQFQVTGKVTVRDNYGDTYTGKYDATATYDPVTDDFSVDYDLGDLYKD